MQIICHWIFSTHTKCNTDVRLKFTQRAKLGTRRKTRFGWKFRSNEYVQELKLNPLKLHQHFRMSIGEFKGTALSTGSTFAQERFIFYVTTLAREHHFGCSAFESIAFLQHKHLMLVCVVPLTSINCIYLFISYIIRIVHLANPLPLCKDLQCALFFRPDDVFVPCCSKRVQNKEKDHLKQNVRAEEA